MMPLAPKCYMLILFIGFQFRGWWRLGEALVLINVFNKHEKTGVELIYKSQGSELIYSQITQLELKSRSYSQSTLTREKVTIKAKLLFWMRNTLQLFVM